MADVDRFETPLYTLGEAGHYLGLSKTTLARWAQGKESGTAIVTTVPGQPRGSAVIPFVGLAEGLVLAVIRRSGVPLQRVRPAVDRLRRELGLTHALASKALYTNGAEVLYDFAEQQGDTPEARSARQLVVVRNNQHVFTEVVDYYLHRVEFAPDGYARVIPLPRYEDAEIVADFRRGFGQPTFVHGGARVEDVLGLFWAGESLATVSEEFGVPVNQLENALRVATYQPAA